MINIPTYVISLERATERRTRVIKHLNEHKVPFKLFDAFDGKKIGISTHFPYIRDHDKKYWDTHPPFYCGEGILALAMSWMALIKMALMNDEKEILVFEDDVFLCDNFVEKFENLYNQLPPNYNALWLGHCCVDKNRVGKISDNLACGYPLTTHAVLLSRAAMEKANEQFVLCAPIDVVFYDWIMKGEPVYISWPEQIATQLSSAGQIPTTL